jgi:hypothetical protein
MAVRQNIYVTAGNVDEIGSWEPKQQNRFLAVLYPPVDLLGVPGIVDGYTPGVTGPDATRKLISMCKSTKRPNLDVGDTGKTTVNFLHEQSVYAGKPANAGTIDLTFRDALAPNPGNNSGNYDVMATLYEWSRMVYDPYTGTMGYKTEYEGTMYLHMLDPHGFVIEDWTFYRVWPGRIDGGNVQYDNAGESEVTVTFNYDKIFRGVLAGG